LAPSLQFIKLARFIEGAAVAFLYSAAPALLMSTTSGARRTTGMSIWASYMPAGSAVGFLMGGAFAGTMNWHNTFVLHGVFMLTIAALALALPRSTQTKSTSTPSMKQRLQELKLGYTQPNMILLALVFFLIVAIGLGTNTSLPSYLSHSHDLKIASVSNIIAVTTIAMIPGSLLAGILMSNGIRRRSLFIWLTALCIILGALVFAPEMTISARIVILTVWFLATGGITAIVMAAMPTVAPPHLRGSTAALVNQAGAIATFISPPVFLYLSQPGHGWTNFIWIMAIGWTLSLLCFWRTLSITPNAHINIELKTKI